MNLTEKPYIGPEQKLPEITLKVILVAVLLTVVLAVANAYLALKIGILTSASIPAAILSMGILRLFKKSNVLENNLIQTAASAGEAIAGGIVYTIPALIIIHYWSRFPYWENFLIALSGSVLGVLFSIPLRRVLMTEKHLRFPEGRAIAEVLQVSEQKLVSMRYILLGSGIGAILQLLQSGVKIIASSVQIWFSNTRVIFGLGAGFSATMMGAGYLIGFDVTASIFAGAIIGWIIAVPVLSEIYSPHIHGSDITAVVMTLWSTKIRYIGIGAMLVSGLWTLARLFKPFCISIISSFAIFKKNAAQQILRTEYDIPLKMVLLGILFMLIITFALFHWVLPLANMGLPSHYHIMFLLGCLIYVAIIGFIFSAICGYFSGLVGVTASPGSAIVISGMLLAALILRFILSLPGLQPIMDVKLHSAAAITIIVGAVITGIACIANDNIQDLKVGHILGSTPWKQQIMLLLGAIVSSAVIPPVMELLFNAYGIADVLPHAGMNPANTLSAPPAALMAAITQGVFSGNLPWGMILAGGILAVIAILIFHLLSRKKIGFSVLGFAIGIYLPIATSTPLFVGGLCAHLVNKRLKAVSSKHNKTAISSAKHRGLLIACGLVAGTAIMDVLVAIPLAISGDPNMLMINLPHWHVIGEAFGGIMLLSLAFWIYHSVTSFARKSNNQGSSINAGK